MVADSKESGLSEQDAAAIAAMEAAEKAQNLANKAIRRYLLEGVLSMSKS